MGIVTGIGDKNLNKNVIVPEIDADLNDYILNKNCIINGLEVIGNTLTAGMCVLKGYRGVLENAETLNGETYIYGKFTLNFDNGITEDLEVDNFEILKTNSEPQDGTINPASINQAGIYYLLLYTYTNGAYVLSSELNTPTYPAHAYEADETDFVSANGVLADGVTAKTQDKNDNSDKPATTAYAHNQIEEEIAYDIVNGQFKSSGGTTIGTYTLKRKAKYVIGTASLAVSGTIQGNLAGVLATFPNGFKPKTNIYFAVYGEIVSYTMDLMQCNTNGEVRIIEDSTVTANEYETTFGYETN